MENSSSLDPTNPSHQLKLFVNLDDGETLHLELNILGNLDDTLDKWQQRLENDGRFAQVKLCPKRLAIAVLDEIHRWHHIMLHIHVLVEPIRSREVKKISTALEQDMAHLLMLWQKYVTGAQNLLQQALAESATSSVTIERAQLLNISAPSKKK